MELVNKSFFLLLFVFISLSLGWRWTRMSVSYPFTMLFHVLHLDQFQTHGYEIFVCLPHIPLGEQICFFSLHCHWVLNLISQANKVHSVQGSPVVVCCITPATCWFDLTFRHRVSCILGQAFHYSPENTFYIFNQQIYFIIWYLLDCASLI